MNALEQLGQRPELECSFLAPSAQPGERTGTFRLVRTSFWSTHRVKAKISVPDFAVVMINDLENPQHIRQRFTAGY